MKKIFESKKAIAMLIGTICVMLVFFSSLIAIIWVKGSAASEIVSLANVAIVFLGMLVSICITGQSAVDFRYGASANLTSEHKVEEKITKNIHIEKGSNIKDKDYKI